MVNQEGFLRIIRELSGQQNTFTIPRLYAEFMEGLDGGLFLNQLVFWSDKGKRPDGFIYKSRSEWQEETLLSDYALRKATSFLKKKGLLETKLLKAEGAPTLHYRLDLEALAEELVRFVDNANGFVEINKSDSLKSTKPGFVENDKSITDDYQKNTRHGGDGGPPVNNSSLAALLEIGVAQDQAETLVSTCRADHIQGWVEYARSARGLNNPAALVVARLRANVPAPTGTATKEPESQFVTCSDCFQVVHRDDICPDCGKCPSCCECEEQ